MITDIFLGFAKLAIAFSGLAASAMMCLVIGKQLSSRDFQFGVTFVKEALCFSFVFLISFIIFLAFR
jgi:hypothetical protein